jgi:hypothetical protein
LLLLTFLPQASWTLVIPVTLMLREHCLPHHLLIYTLIHRWDSWWADFSRHTFKSDRNMVWGEF